jgi:two-component system response regulator YesN
LGAFDFLIKPSKVEVIHQTLERAVKELKRDAGAYEETAKLKSLIEQKMPLLREKALYDIMHSLSADRERAEAGLEAYGVKIGRFIIAVTEFNGDKGTAYDKQLLSLKINGFFGETFESLTPLAVPLSSGKTAFVLNLEEYGLDLCARFIRFLERVRELFAVKAYMGVSTAGNSVLDLPSKLKECLYALEHKLYLSDTALIYYEDLDLSFKNNDYSALSVFREELLDGVRLGNAQTVEKSIGKITRYIGGCKPDKDIKDFFWNTISGVNNIRMSLKSAESDGGAGEYGNIDKSYAIVNACGSVGDLTEVLKEACSRLTGRVNEFKHKNISLKVRGIMDYVEKHYAEPITLYDVSESIYISTYYASRIFKQETGKNFVDYLNEVRLEKAKEFLSDVQYKIYEVADLIGVQDAHYFSRIFKKHTGVTPSEYRDRYISNG